MCAHAVERYRRGGGRSRAVEPGPVQDVEDRNGQSCCLEVPMTLKGDHLVRLRAGNVVAAALAMGLVLVLGSTAMAAPVGVLKQFKVPTANSQPRAITNGSDGNRWFTEGT